MPKNLKVPENLGVRYTHWRYFYTPQGVSDRLDQSYQPAHPSQLEGQTVHPRGGITVCRLLDNGIEVAQGVARCHPDDNFSRKLGRTISLGRALIDYDAHWGELPEKEAD